MLGKAMRWLGFGHDDHHGHGHHHGQDDHGHTHGVIDPTIATTSQGIWAIKWSFAILAVTAFLQVLVVAASGSVALLADTIHNIADATTAIPLWIAFRLVRRRPTATFAYGYGKVEDLAGIVIVLIIFASALVAGYEAANKLIHPEPIRQLGWVAAAGLAGFLGNKAVAVFRIRVGRRINKRGNVLPDHACTPFIQSSTGVAGQLTRVTSASGAQTTSLGGHGANSSSGTAKLLSRRSPKP